MHSLGPAPQFVQALAQETGGRVAEEGDGSIVSLFDPHRGTIDERRRVFCKPC